MQRRFAGRATSPNRRRATVSRVVKPGREVSVGARVCGPRPFYGAATIPGNAVHTRAISSAHSSIASNSLKSPSAAFTSRATARSPTPSVLRSSLPANTPMLSAGRLDDLRDGDAMFRVRAWRPPSGALLKSHTRLVQSTAACASTNERADSSHFPTRPRSRARLPRDRRPHRSRRPRRRSPRDRRHAAARRSARRSRGRPVPTCVRNQDLHPNRLLGRSVAETWADAIGDCPAPARGDYGDTCNARSLEEDRKR